ncbi:MAG: glycosyltransferase family 1 protein [Hyphomicrobiaceae bacterium]
MTLGDLRRVDVQPRHFKRRSDASVRSSGAELELGKRTWTVNGDFVGLTPNGVARYGREVSRALDALIGEHHPLTQGLRLRLVSPVDASDLELLHAQCVVVPEVRSLRLPQVWCQLQLPRLVEGGLLSFCNLAPMIVEKQIVCIHDLHTRLMPESYGIGFRLAHRVILPVLGRRVRAVTTVSSLSKSHLIEFGIAPEPKIHITYNGADHARRWEAARSKRVFRQGRPFVFGFAREQVYKNTELFWRIAVALDARGIDIVLGGDFAPRFADALGALPTNLRLVGRLSDDELAQALSEALCFVFPSRIEGFGIPAVEAMMLGCPVVASSAPCLPEVCADAALFVAPDDDRGWIDGIAALAASSSLRRDLIARGAVRAEAFTWRSIALSYLKLMAEIDGIDVEGDRKLAFSGRF